MKNNYRILSVVFFAISIPALIMTDWYYKGFGLLAMFILLTIGLIFDQLIRIQYPSYKIEKTKKYVTNRLLHMIALVLFLWAPMGLIYGNRIRSKMGFWIMAVSIFCGISADQFGRIKYSYSDEEDAVKRN